MHRFIAGHRRRAPRAPGAGTLLGRGGLPFVASLLLATGTAALAQGEAAPGPQGFIDRFQAAAAPARPAVDLPLQFELNSDRVDKEGAAVVRALAQALQARPLVGSRFLVEGHTDATGRAEFNQRLSERRAEAVRRLLVGRGVAAERLVSSGKGASEPVKPETPEAPENRRVRVVRLD